MNKILDSIVQRITRFANGKQEQDVATEPKVESGPKNIVILNQYMNKVSSNQLRINETVGQKCTIISNGGNVLLILTITALAFGSRKYWPTRFELALKLEFN